MGTIKAVTKRGRLRRLAEIAKSSSTPLRDNLFSFLEGIDSQSFKSGRVYLSTSGSGQSAAFISVPGFLFGTQGEVFDMAEEFIELYDAVIAQQAALGTTLTDGGSTSETDTILAVMLADISMQTVRVAGGDYTLLNIPAVGTAIGGT